MSEKLTVAITAEIEDLKKQLANANNELSKFSGNANKQANAATSSFDKLSDSIANLALGYASLTTAINVLGSSFDRALKLDAINASMAAIMGSSEAAAEQFKKLSDFADQYGLSLISVADSYKSFSASATLANVPLEQTDYIFQSVAKAASVLKLSNDDLRGALNALSQMISKGTVQAEELRGQLGERLPGAFNLAVKAMGVTTAELGKMLEQGQVMAGDLLPKLALELNNTYGDKIVGKVDNLQASINRLDNSFTNAVKGGNIGKFFKEMVDGANDAVKIFESKSWTEFFGRISALATGNELLKFSLDAATLAQKNLNKEISNMPKTDLTKSFGTTVQKPSRVVGGESLEKMFDAKQAMAEAEKLFALYKESPQTLKLLGSEYADNPFFRDLINGDLKEKTDELTKSFNDFLNAKRDDTSGGVFPLDKEIEMINENAQNLVNILGSGLTSAFDAALISGQNFGQVLVKAIGDVIKKLLAALAVSAILSAILGGFGVAASSVGSGATLFGNIFKGLTGFNLGGGASGDKVSTAVATTSNSGSVSFEIRGDKLYGVLQNYQGRLDRLV